MISIKNLMKEERFQTISEKDKEFIIEFDREIQKIGYDFGDFIGKGYCWGNYMITYKKTGVKYKKVIARIYIRDADILLRLYFSKIDKHRSYVENAIAYIKEPFINKNGRCKYCEGKKDYCKFRKIYTIDENEIHKCNGITFEYENPSLSRLLSYMDILKEFYTKKTKQ